MMNYFSYIYTQIIILKENTTTLSVKSSSLSFHLKVIFINSYEIDAVASMYETGSNKVPDPQVTFDNCLVILWDVATEGKSSAI